MPFFASVPFWFLAGKYALENSSIVCRVPRQLFISHPGLLYFRSLCCGDTRIINERLSDISESVKDMSV